MSLSDVEVAIVRSAPYGAICGPRDVVHLGRWSDTIEDPICVVVRGQMTPEGLRPYDAQVPVESGDQLHVELAGSLCPECAAGWVTLSQNGDRP